MERLKRARKKLFPFFAHHTLLIFLPVLVVAVLLFPRVASAAPYEEWHIVPTLKHKVFWESKNWDSETDVSNSYLGPFISRDISPYNTISYPDATAQQIDRLAAEFVDILNGTACDGEEECGSWVVTQYKRRASYHGSSGVGEWLSVNLYYHPSPRIRLSEIDSGGYATFFDDNGPVNNMTRIWLSYNVTTSSNTGGITQFNSTTPKVMLMYEKNVSSVCISCNAYESNQIFVAKVFNQEELNLPGDSTSVNTAYSDVTIDISQADSNGVGVATITPHLISTLPISDITNKLNTRVTIQDITNYDPENDPIVQDVFDILDNTSSFTYDFLKDHTYQIQTSLQYKEGVERIPLLQLKNHVVTIAYDGSAQSISVTDPNTGAESCSLLDIGCHLRNLIKSISDFFKWLFIPTKLGENFEQLKTAFSEKLGFFNVIPQFFTGIRDALTADSGGDCVDLSIDLSEGSASIPLCQLQNQLGSAFNLFRAFNIFIALTGLSLAYFNQVNKMLEVS